MRYRYRPPFPDSVQSGNTGSPGERLIAKQDLLTEPVPSTLGTLAIPMAVGVVFMMLVNIIDTYWAGQLGTDALAAMSFAFPVIGVVINVSIGLMIGVSVAVARVVGMGDLEKAGRLATHSLWLGLIIVGVLTVGGLLTIDPLFMALGAPVELLPEIRAYMRIWYLSAFFLVVPMMLSGVLRAHGDAITPRNTMILAAFINGALDPLLIFGVGDFEGFGLEGAAMATGISRAATLLYASFIAIRMGILNVHIPRPKAFWQSSVTIFRVGIPATVANVLGPFATAAVTAIVALHGAEAVAGYGIGARIDSLMLIPAMALSSALSPFIGQNWGAHLSERVKESFRFSVWFSVAWGVIAAGLMLVIAPWVAGVFTDDPVVAAAATTYLRIVPLGYGAYGALMMVSSAFNAVDRPTRATALSVLRSLVLAIPLALLGNLYGLIGIFSALAASSVLASLFGMRWIRNFFIAGDGRFDPASPTDAAFLLAKTSGAQREATQALITHLEGMGVALHKTRPDAVGFFVGDRELGHIHPSGHVDLPLPPPIGEALVRAGRVTHHRMTESGWYTHQLRDAPDIAEAEWLLALAHVLHAMGRKGRGSQDVSEALASLELDPPLREALTVCEGCWSWGRDDKAS